MGIWAVLDYMDDDGVNVIREWADGLPKKARAKFHSRVEYLRALEKEQWGKKTGPMTGPEWDGIFEIRLFVARIQYRPLFCFGPGRQQITILMGAEERGDKIEPRSAAATCQKRRESLKENKHVTPHDFSSHPSDPKPSG